MLPSIGLIEAGKTPSKIELVEGYYLCTYNDHILSQIIIKTQMLYRYILNKQYIQPIRDIMLLCTGGLLMHLYKKK